MNEVALLMLVGVLSITMLAIWRHICKQNFIDEHGKEIEDQNEEIIRQWKRTNPEKEVLVIDREFKRPGLLSLSPKVRIKRVYRMPGYWVNRLFLPMLCYLRDLVFVVCLLGVVVWIVFWAISGVVRVAASISSWIATLFA